MHKTTLNLIRSKHDYSSAQLSYHGSTHVQVGHAYRILLLIASLIQGLILSTLSLAPDQFGINGNLRDTLLVCVLCDGSYVVVTKNRV